MVNAIINTKEKHQKWRSINDFANQKCYIIHAIPIHIITKAHIKHTSSQARGKTRPFVLLNNKKNNNRRFNDIAWTFLGVTVTVTILLNYTPIHYQIIYLDVGKLVTCCLCDPTDSWGIVIVPFLINQNKGLDWNVLRCTLYMNWWIKVTLVMWQQKCLPKIQSVYCIQQNMFLIFDMLRLCIDLMLSNQSTHEISCGKICLLCMRYNQCTMLENISKG